MYGYYDGFTCAQIDLMTTDCPLILYGKPKGKNGGKSRSKTKNDTPPRPNPAKMKAAIERWQRKYGSNDASGLNLNLSNYSIQYKQTLT